MNETLLRQNAAYTSNVQQLLADMQSYDNDALNRRPASGGWSAMQVMEHLILAETLSFRYVNKKIGFGGPFENRGLATRWRRTLTWLYMNLPFRFKAPKMVNEEQLPESSTLTDVHERWMALRSDWTQFFEQLPVELGNKAIYKHPVAGRLGWPETIDFFTFHLNRHRKQIQRTLA